MIKLSGSAYLYVISSLLSIGFLFVRDSNLEPKAAQLVSIFVYLYVVAGLDKELFGIGNVQRGDSKKMGGLELPHKLGYSIVWVIAFALGCLSWLISSFGSFSQLREKLYLRRRYFS